MKTNQQSSIKKKQGKKTTRESCTPLTELGELGSKPDHNYVYMFKTVVQVYDNL